MKTEWSQQLDLFTRTGQPMGMSREERLKAVTLLQSRLVEATSARSELLTSKEAGDDENHA